MTRPNGPGAAKPSRAWSFGPGGWGVVEDPVPLGEEGAEGWTDALARAGYALYPSIRLQVGRWATDYHLSVYDAREFDRFLVCLGTKSRLYKVVVEGFPQMVEVVNKLTPIAQLGAETQDQDYERNRRSEPTEGLP